MREAPAARSALHPIYEAAAAPMERQHGWHVPLHFGSVEDEVEAARTAMAIGEWFGGGVLEVVGNELAGLAARLGVGDLPPGAAAPVTLPGGESARWLRLTRSHARLLLDREMVARAREALLPWEGCLHVTDVSSGFATLAVIGPRSPDLLARLVRLDLDPRVFGDRRVALTGAVGIPLQVLRWDRGSLLAYELAMGRDVAEYVWEALAHAGEGLGLRHVGAEALSRLRAGG
jgi:glycine cleavage system aminomethyltransferase T